jgi:NitT/TauT family transport system permease protein
MESKVKQKNTLKNTLKKAGAILFALAVWQVITMAVDTRILLVGPVDVLLRLGTIWQVEHFWASIWFTFYHIALGFLLGFGAGIALSALSARYSTAETLLWPFMATVKSVPVASFIVICLIWLSSANVSVFISFLVVMPVVYGNMLSGIRDVDRGLLEMAKVFRMSPVRKLKYIYLPELKSFLLSACGTALGMAWKAGVAAEIIGTPDGSIGKQLYYAKIWLDTDDLLCWTVIIVICSAAFEKAFMALVRGLYRRLEGES